MRIFNRAHAVGGQGSLKRIRFAVALMVTSSFMSSGFTNAHHPDRRCDPVTPRIDLIGPIGESLPCDYRRKYNRPRYILGKIAYYVAPSSQEAMTWHRAVHSDAYKDPKKDMRLERHYFYPKPWEAMRMTPTAAVESVDVLPPEFEGMPSTDELQLPAPDHNVENQPAEQQAPEAVAADANDRSTIQAEQIALLQQQIAELQQRIASQESENAKPAGPAIRVATPKPRQIR